MPELGGYPGRGQGNPLQYSTWRIPRTEESGGLQFMGSQRVVNWATRHSQQASYIEWKALTQYVMNRVCLKYIRSPGSAFLNYAVHGVPKSRTRLSDWTEITVGGKNKKKIQHCQKTLKLWSFEGEQNMPPLNMSVWHNDYFELKLLERPASVRTYWFPLFPWKQINLP